MLKKVFRNPKLKHLWPLVIYMICYLIWFGIVERVPRSSYFIIGASFDRAIPFIEVFVVPYFSWFPFLVIWSLYLYFKDRDAYDCLATFLMIGMTVFLLVSTFFPNRLDLRLTSMPRNNIFTAMVAFLWKLDTPTDVWPSIHVYNTAAVEIMLLRSKDSWLQKKAVRFCLVLWGVLIILATVFIKQHSIFDIITGFLMTGIVAWMTLERGIVFRFQKRKA
ncbi:MAG TPA: phosphatase PAP2 family protein [Lachnospiraceae bacterium]|nr:phosphatase PAP2 family protein [Lachnospiraceae bacterium]